MIATPLSANSGSTDMFSLLGPEFLADPYSFYSSLYKSGPVQWVPGVFGMGAWVVTSHSSCVEVLRSKIFGKEGEKVLLAEKMARIEQENAALLERRRGNMLYRDPPDHTRLRSLVSLAFTPRTVEKLGPKISRITDSLLDAMAGSAEADLIQDFAFPLPIIVIAELLGVPPEERQRFKSWSTDITLGASPVATAEDQKKNISAGRELDEYMRQIVELRRATPQADLISDLVRAQEQGSRLSMNELLATCRVLLAAGHETTVNLIGNGMLALFRHPSQRAELAADPSLLPNAVEELLRYDSPLQLTLRFAFEDTQLQGQTIKRGELLVLLLGGANRDPAQFADPDQLELRRKNASTHLSFGQGIHYCLGASLARLEGEIAIGALLRRFPDMKLATPELKWRRNITLRGLQSLRVCL